MVTLPGTVTAGSPLDNVTDARGALSERSTGISVQAGSGAAAQYSVEGRSGLSRRPPTSHKEGLPSDCLQQRGSFLLELAILGRPLVVKIRIDHALKVGARLSGAFLVQQHFPQKYQC